MISEPPREVLAELKPGERLLWWDYVRLEYAENAESSALPWVIGLPVFALGMKLGFDFLGVLFSVGGPRKLFWPHADEGTDPLWTGPDPVGPYIYLLLLTGFCITLSLVCVRMVTSAILALRPPGKNWKNCAAVTESRLIEFERSLDTVANSYSLDTIRHLRVTPRPDGSGTIYFECPGARVLSGEIAYCENEANIEPPDFRRPEEKNRSLRFYTAHAEEGFEILERASKAAVDQGNNAGIDNPPPNPDDPMVAEMRRRALGR